MKADPDRRHWSWYVSALLYRLSYFQLAHQLDDDLFRYLGGQVDGSVVADCGCGPGVVTQKFLERGARRVFAIDGNPPMIRQVHARLAQAIASRRVIPVLGRFHPGLFPELCQTYLGGSGFDILLFKRSLYSQPERALPVLQAACACLNPGGVLALVHAERSVRRYAFGPGLRWQPYTAYHLLNRLFSLLGRRLGLGEYTLYTQAELVELARRAAPDKTVEIIPSGQQSYNLVGIRG
jgi:SAM-dependent methyltransferase